MKVRVYHFRWWDASADRRRFPHRKSTADRIHECHGEIIDGSEEEVDESALDEHGRYDPRDKDAPASSR